MLDEIERSSECLYLISIAELDGDLSDGRPLKYTCRAAAPLRMKMGTLRRGWTSIFIGAGLEDNIYLSKGELAQSNAAQVAKIVRILKELSLEIASPEEARQMLGLNGVLNVGF